MRELADEVLPPQFDRAHVELPRRDLHHAFDDIGRFRPPCPAIGVDRRGVGVDRLHIRVDRRDVVLARQQRRAEIGRRHRREQRHVGAEIDLHVDLEAGDLVVLVERHLGMRVVVAAMRVGQEALGAVGDPFHRHAGLLRGPQADDLFRIDVDLRAEAAADIGRDDAQLVFRRDIVEGAHHQPREMRVLRGRPAGVVVLRLVVMAERGARLHRVRHQPVVDDVELDDMRGLRERRGGFVGIAEVPVEDQIVLRLRMDLRRALAPSPSTRR